ncbi:hypothetical protein R3P38DRAFT_2556461, partial [Favolaschia claudopus]
PTIGSVVKFEQNWWQWWAKLQPHWRVRDRGPSERFIVKKDWESLRVPGQNGMVSVLATLYWWGVKW